jgi:hypothetical protein
MFNGTKNKKTGVSFPLAGKFSGFLLRSSVDKDQSTRYIIMSAFW